MTATQSAFNQGYTLGAVGDIADSGPYDQISGAAAEAMPNGGAFLVETATEDKYRLVKRNKLTVLGSADFTSGNVTVTIRTTNLAGTNEDTAISTAFNSDHDTTVTDLLSDLNAIDDITATATDSSGDNRTIQIVLAGDKALDTLVDFAATGVTFTETWATTDASAIAGISRRDCTKEKDLDGSTQLSAGDDVGVVREGRIFVFAEEAITKSSDLFTRFTSDTATGTNRGNLRASAGSSPAIAGALGSGISVHKSAAASGVAVIELGLRGS